jgi:HEAT repeat protein
VIRILGELGDSTLTPFFRTRFELDDSYQVQAEALRAIGRTGDQNQLDFIHKASQMPSPRDVIRRAAEWAKEEIRRRM